MMQSNLRARVESLAANSPLLLEELAWPDIEAIQNAGDAVLILPIGATEQHGPHLPISMDTILAEAVCWYASAKTGSPVLPALRYTVSQGHTAKWPGTFSLTHETFISEVEEISDWACRTGWKRLLMVNSHFGNDAPARVALDKIRLALMGRFQIGFRNVFDLSPEIRKAYFEDVEDLHANKAETDLMLHLSPELVHMDRLKEADDTDRTTAKVFSYPVAQTSLNGVTGFPSKSSEADGEALFSKITDALIELINKARTESSPLPKEYWENI